MFEHVMIGAIAREEIRANKESLKQHVLEVLKLVGLTEKKDTLAKNLTAVDKNALSWHLHLRQNPSYCF